MATEAEIAAAEQAKQTEAAKLEAEAKAKADAEKNNTVGKLFNKGEKKEARVVPEAVLIETKKALKEAQATIEEMKSSGATKKEINASLKEIAEKYEVDEDFVNDIASAVKSDTDKELDEKISSRLKPIEEKERREQTSKMFKDAYKTALENLGEEYKKVASEATIQALAREASSDPDRKDLTIEQILRETYGHLIKGTKKSVENIRPKDGANQTAIDFDRAKTDTEYYKEIMADPQLKAEYNKDLHKRNRF